MSISKLREWWSHRQGLDRCAQGRHPADVLATTGWARSVGGAAPYLTLFARARTRRDEADAAVAKLEIQELPAARGCTYVVPAADFALALKVGQAFTGGDMNTACKLGVTHKEIDRLCAKVIGALAKGPLDPEALRDAAGAAVRNLGVEGKKRGLTTTMPLALERLQAEGEIRRIPTNGRLDQQRYRYALWRPNPLATFTLSIDEANVELARRYFSWIGPATAGEFQWFSGLGVKAAKAAIEPLKLVPCPDDATRLMHGEDRDAYARFTPSEASQPVLVSSLDGLSLLRRDLANLLDEADGKRQVLSDGGAKPLGGLADLPDHAIFDRGRLVGLWEFDPEAQDVAWWTFGATGTTLAEAVARTESFVRDDLGDARSFSLDSARSRAPRIAALRKAAKR